jgi:hypothetical protein
MRSFINVIRVTKSRRIRWTGHVACIGYGNTYKILVRKTEGKRMFGRPRRRWEDNIKTDLRKTGWEDMDWKHLAQDRTQWRTIVNTAMYLRIP